MIIGIMGKAGAGKTTAAKFLMGKYGFRRVGFADAIKQHLYSLGLFSWDELWINKTKASRAAMQEFGEWVRKYDFMFWNDKCASAIEDLQRMNERNIVVDDVRRVSEAEMIQAMGGKLLRIYRDEIDDITDYSHPSEMEADDIICDAELRNNTSLDQLFEGIELFYATVGGLKWH
jgi:hypothetical protein